MPLRENEKRLLRLAAAQSNRRKKKNSPRVRMAIRRAREKQDKIDAAKTKPAGVGQDKLKVNDRLLQEKAGGVRRKSRG